MRNSEKFTTAEERAKAFNKWCVKARDVHECKNCDKCHFAWLELEAEKEDPLPCPFCGSDVRDFYNCGNTMKKLICDDCGYQSPWVEEDKEHILHNRVARAVMEDNEAKNGGEAK